MDIAVGCNCRALQWHSNTSRWWGYCYLIVSYQLCYTNHATQKEAAINDDFPITKSPGSEFLELADHDGGEKRIPFEVSADPFYSEENMARLRKSAAQMESTGGTIREVI